MKIVIVNGKLLKNMVIYGIYTLNQHRDELDSLNIFPVPDGDTGINMSLTSLQAVEELNKLADSCGCDEVAEALARGSLRGARGNSGVILSQLFRGLSKGFKNKKQITTEDFSAALTLSSATAYKAVMKPKEGTVLTLARSLAEKSRELSQTEDFDEFFKALLEHGNEVLKMTTNMLPALKAAGVVDSGAKGLLYIYEGMYEGLTKDLPKDLQQFQAKRNEQKSAVSMTQDHDITFTYCTEFFIERKNADDKLMKALTSDLEKIGDSIVAVNDDEIIKIHVHTDNPGTVLERALKLGQLSNVKIDNMRIQHTSIIEKVSEAPETMRMPEEEPERQSFVPKVDKTNQAIGIIAVSVGEGINNIFRDLGCDYIIEGGQSMNPSAEDFIKAAEEVNKDDYIILPNNKNIVLAARQAAQILEIDMGKKVRVIETKSIPQGIGAVIAMAHDKPLSQTAEIMEEGAKAVQTGLVTVAIRDTEIDGKTVKKGNFLGIIESKIEFVEETQEKAAKKVIEYFSMDCELISVYYGEKSFVEEGRRIIEYIEELGLESDLQYGGQPVYSYVISAE